MRISETKRKILIDASFTWGLWHTTQPLATQFFFFFLFYVFKKIIYMSTNVILFYLCCLLDINTNKSLKLQISKAQKSKIHQIAI
jgi:hypothetical protein